MNRAQLEHIIRAAAAVSDDDELIIIGSQSVLGQFPDAPESLCVSIEADLYPKNHPERWDLIDGSLGEESPFHQTFGYYAQGVSEETAVLPRGWKDRLIRIRNPNTRYATGWTLDIHDLLISKLVAGRPKDFEFVREAVRHGLADRSILCERLAVTAVEDAVAERVAADIRALP